MLHYVQHHTRTEWTAKIAKMLCYSSHSKEYRDFVTGILQQCECDADAFDLLMKEGRWDELIVHLERLQQTLTLSLPSLICDIHIDEAIRQANIIEALKAAIAHYHRA